MSIQSAILGILSWKPSTGYDLKKLFEASSFMPWSGNNNQIYKALLGLEGAGLVRSEVVAQETAPAKKVYTVTGKGLTELKNWLVSAPEVPELRNTFLIQLAWSHILSDEEISRLLSSYEEAVALQLVMEQEKQRRTVHSPHRSARERLVWDLISKNVSASYQHELDWIREARRRFSDLTA